MALGHQPISAAPLSAIAAAAGAPGVIQPAHLASGSAFFAPSLRLSLAATTFANAQSFGAPTIRLTVTPVALGSGNAFYNATVSAGVTILPGSFTNGSNFHGASIQATLKPAAHTNGQSFFAPRLNLGVAAASFANGSTFYSPLLTLRLSASLHTNAGAFHSPTVFQPGVINAPFVASGGAIFAPSVAGPQPFAVTGVLNVAGWAPRAPARRRQVATWPNLPKVEAPPWRLMVVTPQVARERARAQIAWRKRAREQKRKRDVDRRVEAIFNQIVDDEVVRTVVRLVGEDA